MTSTNFDFFKTRKGIHVQLDKDVQRALRIKLFTVGLSMQDVFEAFAVDYVNGSPAADHIVQSMVRRKINDAVNGTITKRAIEEIRKSSTFDNDLIYDLINADDSNERDDEKNV